MRHALALLFSAIFLVSACDSPDARYWGETGQDVEINGRRYSVHTRPHSKGREVQVIRHGYARRPEHIAILDAMRQAAEQVSGCTIRDGSVRGDSGVMTARLNC